MSRRLIGRATRLLVLAALGAGLISCRGNKSGDPPLHLVEDMDWQQKMQPQEASSIFADGRAMRPKVDGTVAQGQLHDDDAYYTGQVDGKFVRRVPVDVDKSLAERGQDRFNIYCAPCHDMAGTGKGAVVARGFPPPIALGSDRLLEMRDGEIFNVISHGVRNMPGYGAQIPVEDRWAIVTWVRILGHSQYAPSDAVPGSQRGTIKQPEEAVQ